MRSQTLNRETRNVQNEAIGAVLLWRFTVGYEQGSEVNNPAPLPLLFVVLPILLHEETFQQVKSTQARSGLRGFAEKFAESKTSKEDLVLAIQSRASEMRLLTAQSLTLAMSSNLVGLDCGQSAVVALTSTAMRFGVPESVRLMMRGAEKLGQWCSTLSIYEISIILKMRF
jgi:hypothetical protein